MKTTCLTLLPWLCLTAAACGGSESLLGGSASDSPKSTYAGPMSAAGSSGSSPTSPTTDVNTIPQGGGMTAGAWDDNANFDFYAVYLATTMSSQIQGLPIIDRTGRVVVQVQTPTGEPVAGAQVQVADGAGHVFTSTTGGEGRVLYFPVWNGVAIGSPIGIQATLANDVAEQATVAEAGVVTLTLGQTARPEIGALDLAFVIDTTGSMGDELSYLQRELDTIVGAITTQFSGLMQRLALIVYRDVGDQYVLRTFDFTTDLATFRGQLAAQSAGGGGDMPEAVDQALAAVGQLSWQPGTAARVAFWIADAPHHAGREQEVVSALKTAVGQAVHLYPIAASGIDELAEFTMRTAAEVTGGRYLFLTDDSGIGNAHAEPHIPCYYVTSLESAIRRMVFTELSGSYIAPPSSEIIRTSGNPEGQQCDLSGTVFTVW